MEIDDYYNIIESLGKEYSAQPKPFRISTTDFLDKKRKANNSLTNLFIFRKDFFGDLEREKSENYQYDHPDSAFKDCAIEDRKVWVFIGFEIEEVSIKIHFQTKCAKYEPDQPLFKLSPNLWDQVFNDELVNAQALAFEQQGCVLKFEGGFAAIDHELNSKMLLWAREAFPKSPQFIRVPPYGASVKIPPITVTEAAVVPANPNWWKTLKIQKYNKEGASYLLEDTYNENKPDQFWEYHVNKIRKLEACARRDNQGLLSMMLEELQLKPDGFLIGRCIHLDTYETIGTPFEKAILKHLDLAINVYYGDAIEKRLAGDLANGAMVTNSSCRTHFFRINDVPFTSLLEFSRLFFVSTTLYNEWIADQFGFKLVKKEPDEV